MDLHTRDIFGVFKVVSLRVTDLVVQDDNRAHKVHQVTVGDQEQVFTDVTTVLVSVNPVQDRRFGWSSGRNLI